jgi:hypothetical protein
MSLDLKSASEIVQKNLPGSKIFKAVDHGNLFLFLVESDDPDESGFDPFFSVNKTTGDFSDFSILGRPDTLEIANKFKNPS